MKFILYDLFDVETEIAQFVFVQVLAVANFKQLQTERKIDKVQCIARKQ